MPEGNVNVTIVRPEGEVSGAGDPGLSRARVGDIIQMVRIGFGRVDSKRGKSVTVFFAHK